MLYVGMLGFSSGLPYLLSFATLSLRLAQSGVEVVLIGFLAWISLVNNLKFLWAPVLDRYAAPGMGRSAGRRRGWVVLCQMGVAASLAGLAVTDPAAGLLPVALLALLTVFWSASQDVAIDAWRIELARDEAEAGLLAAAHLWGYRGAMVAGGGGTLYLAGSFGWEPAYLAAAGAMGLLATAVLLLPTPRAVGVQAVARPAWRDKAGGVLVALLAMAAVSLVILAIGRAVPELAQLLGIATDRRDVALRVAALALLPFLAATLAIQRIRRDGTETRWGRAATTAGVIEFLHRFGWAALLLLAFTALFRLGDLVMGAIGKTLYAHLGYTAQTVGAVEGTIGLAAAMTGVALGGLSTGRLGPRTALLLGGGLAAAGNLAFAWLALSPVETWRLALAVGLDGFGGGVASAVFIVFLAGLTCRRHAGTQYALLSSFAFLVPQLVAGSSGLVQASVGYAGFFAGTAALALPALLLVPLVVRIADRHRAPSLDAFPSPSPSLP
ncbi:MAG: hypothetical protein RLY86_4050 [Pseudomonadota bacterium]|jgi:PAT family beta-lactamase induction signal transducer AmpG